MPRWEALELWMQKCWSNSLSNSSPSTVRRQGSAVTMSYFCRVWVPSSVTGIIQGWDAGWLEGPAAPLLQKGRALPSSEIQCRLSSCTAASGQLRKETQELFLTSMSLTYLFTWEAQADLMNFQMWFVGRRTNLQREVTSLGHAVDDDVGQHQICGSNLRLRVPIGV